MGRNAVKIISEAMAFEWKKEVINYLNSIELVPEPMELELLQMLRPHYKPKGHLLLDPFMKYHNDATFIRAGRAKLYIIDQKTGKQQILHIWSKGEVIVLIKMFRKRLENIKYYIELMENGELVSISNDNMKLICETYPIVYKISIEVLEVKTEHRMNHLEILSHPEKARRPAMFEERFPKLKNVLNNEDRSAFIGTGESTLFRANHINNNL